MRFQKFDWNRFLFSTDLYNNFKKFNETATLYARLCFLFILTVICYINDLSLLSFVMRISFLIFVINCFDLNSLLFVSTDVILFFLVRTTLLEHKSRNQQEENIIPLENWDFCSGLYFKIQRPYSGQQQFPPIYVKRDHWS